MNFAVPHKTLGYADYLLSFYLLYHDIHNLDITNEKKDVLRTRIKDCVSSSFNSYNENGLPLNLTPEEFAASKSLSKFNWTQVTVLPLLTKVIILKKYEISCLILVNFLKFL